ncbi:MAG: hypothetical protein ACP5NV_05365 [Candidatus Woesearchaeota archaeon]
MKHTYGNIMEKYRRTIIKSMPEWMKKLISEKKNHGYIMRADLFIEAKKHHVINQTESGSLGEYIDGLVEEELFFQRGEMLFTENIASLIRKYERDNKKQYAKNTIINYFSGEIKND